MIKKKKEINMDGISSVTSSVQRISSWMEEERLAEWSLTEYTGPIPFIDEVVQGIIDSLIDLRLGPKMWQKEVHQEIQIRNLMEELQKLPSESETSAKLLVAAAEVFVNAGRLKLAAEATKHAAIIRLTRVLKRGRYSEGFIHGK